jgi:hypothetical protein
MKKIILALTLFSSVAFATQPSNPSGNNGPTNINVNPAITLSNKNYVDVGVSVTNKLTNTLGQKQQQSQGQEQYQQSQSFSQASGNGGSGVSNVNISETSITNIPKNTPSLATLFGYGSQSPANCSNSVGGSAAAEGKGFSVLFPWQDEVCYFLLMADRLEKDADRFNNFKTKEVICVAMKNENDPIAEAREEIGYSCHDERLDNEAAFARIVKEANEARQQAYLIAKEQLAKTYFDKSSSEFDKKIGQLFQVLLSK